MATTINILLALFAMISSLAAFGGETCPKGEEPLLQRVTRRGWVALSCLLVTFTLITARELYARHLTRESDELRKLVEQENKIQKEKLDKYLEDTRDLAKRLDIYLKEAQSKGIAIESVNPNVTNGGEIVQEMLNAAVSVALSGEEQLTAGNVSAALQRFLQADTLADVAAIKARIADCYVRLGKYEEAVKYEEAAIQLAPNWNGPPYILAFSLFRLGRLAEAISPANRSCALGFDGGCKLAKEIKAAMQRSESP